MNTARYLKYIWAFYSIDNERVKKWNFGWFLTMIKILIFPCHIPFFNSKEVKLKRNIRFECFCAHSEKHEGFATSCQNCLPNMYGFLRNYFVSVFCFCPKGARDRTWKHFNLMFRSLNWYTGRYVLRSWMSPNILISSASMSTWKKYLVTYFVTFATYPNR